MRMPITLMRSYLSTLTTVAPGPGENPMDRMEGFDGSIALLRSKLTQGADDKWLRLAMKSLISAPDGRILDFRGMSYSFSEAELVRLLTYAYQKLWSEDPEFDDVETPDISFEPISDDEWAKEREVQELLYGY